MKNQRIYRFVLPALLVSMAAFGGHVAPTNAAPSAAKAAGQKAKGGPKNGRLKQIIKQLGLSQAQTTKIEAIWKKSQTDMKALNGNKSFTPEQKKARRGVIVADRMANVRQQLTPAQRQKLEAMLAAAKKQHAAPKKS